MTEHSNLTKSQRLMRELRNYLFISAYLYVCFGVLLLYKSDILKSEGIEFAPFGVALVQALVLGKFLLIGEALSVGKRSHEHPLLHRIVWKTGAFFLVLLFFKAIEEVIVGWLHDKTLGQVVTEVMARTWLENLAPSLLMLLILIPMIGAVELNRSLGKEHFRRLLLERSSTPQ